MQGETGSRSTTSATTQSPKSPVAETKRGKPALAGLAWRVIFTLRSLVGGIGRIRGRVSARKNLGPGGKGLQTAVLRGQAEDVVLMFPFGREIPQARHANAPRQTSIDCGLDQRRCEEGKCNRSIDLSDTAGFPLRNLFNIRDRSGDQLIQPTPPRCDRGDQLGTGLGPYRTWVLT